MRDAYEKAVADLDQWTERFHDTDFADERAYYYMLAYNGLDQPVKVVDTERAAAERKPANAAFEDPMQALSVLYLTAANLSKTLSADAGPIGHGADGGAATTGDTAGLLYAGA